MTFETIHIPGVTQRRKRVVNYCSNCNLHEFEMYLEVIITKFSTSKNAKKLYKGLKQNEFKDFQALLYKFKHFQGLQLLF